MFYAILTINMFTIMQRHLISYLFLKMLSSTRKYNFDSYMIVNFTCESNLNLFSSIASFGSTSLALSYACTINH